MHASAKRLIKGFALAWFPKEKQSSALRLHACAFFQIEDFKKDCNLKGDHARAEPLIGNPKGYPDHLCAAKLVKTEGFKSILLAQPSGDDLVRSTSMVTKGLQSCASYPLLCAAKLHILLVQPDKNFLLKIY